MSGASNPQYRLPEPQAEQESLEEWLVRHKRRATLTTLGESVAAFAVIGLIVGLYVFGTWLLGAS